jgi:hypothetical protein
MAAGPPIGGEAARVLISYVRGDSDRQCARLRDRLAKHLGDEAVFIDVADLAPESWREFVAQAVVAADVVLLVIGRRFLEVAGPDGRPAAFDETRVPAVELRSALEGGVPVIPVLVEDARVPDVAEVPPWLTPVLERQSAELGDATFDKDVEGLLATIEHVVAEGAFRARESAAAPESAAPVEKTPTPQPPPAEPEPSLYERLSPSSRQALGQAEGIRTARGRPEVHMEDLLLGLHQKNPGPTRNALADAGIDDRALRDVILDSVEAEMPETWTPVELTALPPVSSHVRRALDGADRSARDDGSRSVRSRHLLAGALSVEDCDVVAALRERGVRPFAPSWYLPSPKIATDRWTDQDQLGYDVYADALTRFLHHPETTSPLTIAVKGPWGAGKTSLMRMVRSRIDPDPESRFSTIVGGEDGEHRLDRLTNRDVLKDRWERPTSPGRQPEAGTFQIGPPPDPPQGWRPTVWFNPWTRQAAELPWAGLAHEIVKQVVDRVEPAARERFWLSVRADELSLHPPPSTSQRLRRELAREVRPAAAGALAALLAAGLFLLLSRTLPDTAKFIGELLAGGATLTATGAAVVAFKWGRSFLRDQASTSDRDVAQLVQIPDYGAPQGPLQLLHRDLMRVVELVATDARPLVVFVDDLDRCSATALNQVIEGINLFLTGDFGHCIFVMALEPDVVAAQMGQVYAQLELPDLTASERGWRFLDKVVTLPLSLPSLTTAQVRDYVSALLDVEAAIPAGEGLLDDAVAQRIRDEVSGTAFDFAGIRAATVRAVESVGIEGMSELPLPHEFEVVAQEAVADRFRDDAPEIREIVQRYAHLLAFNPRAIKRFLNVLRFYSFVSVGLTLRSLSAPDLQQAGKIGILAVRWPHLLTRLVRPADGHGSSLALLESEATSDGSVDWVDVLTRAGFTPEQAKDTNVAVELPQFLRDPPQIAAVAATLL